jgi:hypothetical protein
MSVPQFSVRSTSFAVLLIAADCALLRLVIGGYPPMGLVFGVFGILPMANILAIACYKNLSRRTAGRPFFVGFGVSGTLLVLVWFNVCMTADEKRLTAFNNWMNRTVKDIASVHDIARSIEIIIDPGLYYATVYVFFFTLLTTLPQLLLALFAGWVARRFRAAVRPGLPSAPQSRHNAPSLDAG